MVELNVKTLSFGSAGVHVQSSVVVAVVLALEMCV